MEQVLRDTLGMGALLWLAGYLASMAVYFSLPDYAVWGRVVLVLYVPLALGITAWYFAGRELSLRYYAAVGIAWSITAIVLDYPFIVLRFGAFQYYTPDVYLYYALMFLIPLATGMYYCRQKDAGETGGPSGRHR
jgi:hypothetical protein